MKNVRQSKSRRHLLGQLLLASLSLSWWVSATRASASRLLATPKVSEGPFYPPAPTGLPFFRAKALVPLPLKNDLTKCVEGQPPEGEAFDLQGQVLSQTGIPIADALVEIWQVDARGHYAVEVDAKRDPRFAGYGRCQTDLNGRYNFITIKPSGYSRYGGLIKRAAHIHVRVSAAGLETLTSEIWFDGAAGNESDSFIRRITEKELRQRMLLQLIPVPGGRPVARFNIILES